MSMLRPAIMACALAMLAHSSALAQVGGFRIETELYHGNEKSPFASNLTLFTPTAVYDFMGSGSSEITIFDPRHGTFVILDEARRKKTTITTESLLMVTQEMKTQLLSGAANRRFLAAPPFQEALDLDGKTLRLECPQLTYHVSWEQAPDPSAARRWRAFADWYAQLNAARPSGQPPFARLILNEALAKRELIPLEVRLTMEAPGRLGARTVHLRSKHIVSWRLIRSDEPRMDRAESLSREYEEVPYEEFRRLTDLAARASK